MGFRLEPFLTNHTETLTRHNDEVSRPILPSLGQTRGRLLVATPPLADPNFDRTVVYVLEHTDDDVATVRTKVQAATTKLGASLRG